MIFGFSVMAQDRNTSPPLSLCEISQNYGDYRGKTIAVRGVFFYGLRQTCPQKCGDGPWPSFLWLEGDAFSERSGGELARIERDVEQKAKATGKRFEIWVTAVGRLQTNAKLSRKGPCDRMGSYYFGYGHLGAFPAEFDVTAFRDIEVKENPKSEYDYAHMHHGAL